MGHPVEKSVRHKKGAGIHSMKHAEHVESMKNFTVTLCTTL